MKKCGPLDPETGVAHRSRQGHEGCLVRAETSKRLWELEPRQRQSSGLRWGKTSWVRCGEIPCLHLSRPWVPPAPYLEASCKDPGKRDFLQIQSTAKPNEAGQEQGMDIRTARNVNISNPVPWCQQFPPSIYSWNCQVIFVLPTMCKIIFFSFEIYLELFRLFQSLFWVNFFVASNSLWGKSLWQRVLHFVFKVTFWIFDNSILAQ